MIRLRQLGITGFRGALDLLVVDLTSSGRSIAVFGENAAGKSTITDAIEWFYTDRIEHLWREYCKESSLRNTLLLGTDNAVVQLSFDDPAVNSTKTLSPALDSAHSNTTPRFRTYLEQVQKGQERLALRNADLLLFILSTKTEKRGYLARIIGYEALDTFRNVIQHTQSQLENNPEYVTATRNLGDYQSEILRLAGEMVTTDADLYKSAQQMVTQAGVVAAITDDASYSGAIQAIRERFGRQEKGQAKLKLIQVKQQFEKLLRDVQPALASSKNFLEAYGKLLTSREDLRQIKLLDFLSSGRRILEGKLFEPDVCPFCLQPKNHEALLEKLRERLQKLDEIKRLQEEAVAKKELTISDLNSASEATKVLLDRLVEAAVQSPVSGQVEQYKTSVDRLASEIKQQFPAFGPITSEVETDSTHLSTLLPPEIERVDAEIKALELSQEEQKLIDLLQNLDNLRTNFCKYRESSQTKAAFECQIRTLDTIKSKFCTLHSKTIQQALDAMSQHISRYYLAMHPNEQVDDIKLTALEEGVEFQYTFHGKLTYPPIKYLCESHLNSLGIAAFLASAKLFNSTNGFFVLDDVVTSFDANHRLRLLRVLKDEFNDWQILLLTHEPMWFELIKKELVPAGWLIREIEMIPGAGICLKISAKDMKDFVAKKKAAGTLHPNDVRTLLERILKEICYELHVKVDFRYDDDNERRMPGELLSELRSALRRKNHAVNDDPVLTRVETSSFIATTGSHDSGPALSSADLDVAYTDVLEFDRLFCCATCRTYVATQRYVNHEKKVYCKCGHKSIDWSI